MDIFKCDIPTLSTMTQKTHEYNFRIFHERETLPASLKKMLNVTEQRQIICFILLSILKGNFESESTADIYATKILTMFEEISN